LQAETRLNRLSLFPPASSHRSSPASSSGSIKSTVEEFFAHELLYRIVKGLVDGKRESEQQKRPRTQSMSGATAVRVCTRAPSDRLGSHVRAARTSPWPAPVTHNCARPHSRQDEHGAGRLVRGAQAQRPSPAQWCRGGAIQEVELPRRRPLGQRAQLQEGLLCGPAHFHRDAQGAEAEGRPIDIHFASIC